MLAADVPPGAWGPSSDCKTETADPQLRCHFCIFTISGKLRFTYIYPIQLFVPCLFLKLTCFEIPTVIWNAYVQRDFRRHILTNKLICNFPRLDMATAAFRDIGRHSVIYYMILLSFIILQLGFWVRLAWRLSPSISRVPGPSLGRWSRFWIAKALASGRSHEIWVEVNAEYGI